MIHEDFSAMHPLIRANADQVAAILKNALLRINLNIQRACGQSCDEAATKADKKTGVTENAYTRIVMDMRQISLSLMP